MDEFKGNKFLTIEGGDYYSAEYVDWLEARVDHLAKQLADANQKHAEFWSRVTQPSVHPRVRAVEHSDYVPYPDEDDR
jgi:hypothetical protein